MDRELITTLRLEIPIYKDVELPPHIQQSIEWIREHTGDITINETEPRNIYGLDGRLRLISRGKETNIKPTSEGLRVGSRLSWFTSERVVYLLIGGAVVVVALLLLPRLLPKLLGAIWL